MTPYTLPELPYSFDALEPHISTRIMQLHHDKHHAAYVKGANDALGALEKARASSELEAVAALERALAFNLSGHIMHSLFWTCLAPDGGGAPEGDLGAAIARDFGTFDAFKKQLTQAAATVMGSGWATLSWEPLGKRLVITQIYDHQSNGVQGSEPLLVLDVWEHAFYLQYENRKADYLAAIWNVWNWSEIGRRFEQRLVK